MEVKIFGKHDCPVCSKVKQKFEFFISKWGYKKIVKLRYYDILTVDGLAESAFYEVPDIPTVIIEKDGKEIARWVKRPPVSKEFKSYFTKLSDKSVPRIEQISLFMDKEKK